MNRQHSLVRTLRLVTSLQTKILKWDSESTDLHKGIEVAYETEDAAQFPGRRFIDENINHEIIFLQLRNIKTKLQQLTTPNQT